MHLRIPSTTFRWQPSNRLLHLKPPPGELPKTWMHLAVKYMPGYHSDLLHKLLWETFLDRSVAFASFYGALAPPWQMSSYQVKSLKLELGKDEHSQLLQTRVRWLQQRTPGKLENPPPLVVTVFLMVWYATVTPLVDQTLYSFSVLLFFLCFFSSTVA